MTMTSSWGVRQLLLISLQGLFAVPIIASNNTLTEKHEQGRCAIRGHCGKESFFGPDLPCPDNGLAEKPDGAVRRQLVEICGAGWAEGPVCCVTEQVGSYAFGVMLKYYAHRL